MGPEINAMIAYKTADLFSTEPVIAPIRANTKINVGARNRISKPFFPKGIRKGLSYHAAFLRRLIKAANSSDNPPVYRQISMTIKSARGRRISRLTMDEHSMIDM